MSQWQSRPDWDWDKEAAMLGEPTVRLTSGDAAVWVTLFVLAGTALGWVIGRWAK